ncbi:uncharacterized protein LOC108632142 isoform X2 [Ceratina calcarata]|nr:uncharacterized protein LOC108632142 isoform X2 [Ceratina calcarata]XP_026675261.1 uncharacterized protein LOC108632142 isoform X2 [Ceratina calcarata]
MENRNFNFDGFYTEEIRNQNGGRIGFDVVPLKNLNGRSILARAGNLAGEVRNRGRRKPTIGNYCVFVDDFEKTALPIFDSNTDVLIIDEIGKMELLSEKFFEAVSKLFQTNSKLPFIIATVPLMSKVKNSRKYSSFFEEIHKDKRSIVITVNSQNRDKVPEQILQIIS